MEYFHDRNLQKNEIKNKDLNNRLKQIETSKNEDLVRKEEKQKKFLESRVQRLQEKEKQRQK